MQEMMMIRRIAIPTSLFIIITIKASVPARKEV
jgi:hypothetical protein